MVVPKRSGVVRICVDLKPLNESVLRECHPNPKVDDTLALLHGATVFSKLDANSGFWNIPMLETSHPLATFITPFGRYHFNNFPLESPVFQSCSREEWIPFWKECMGMVCLMDMCWFSFFFYKDEHDTRLMAVLQRLEKAGMTLNFQKCQFLQGSINFIMLWQEWYSCQPREDSRYLQHESLQSVSDLRRFMDLVNQLGKISSRITEISQPVREQLHSNRVWIWGPDQEKLFYEIK